jgi:hypothetical protein
MAKKVKLEVTDKGAIYIDDFRISYRDTKWGHHNILFTAKVLPNQVSKTLADNGYGHIRLDSEYAAEVGIK